MSPRSPALLLEPDVDPGLAERPPSGEQHRRAAGSLASTRVSSFSIKGQTPKAWWIRLPSAGQADSTARTFDAPTTQPAYSQPLASTSKTRSGPAAIVLHTSAMRPAWRRPDWRRGPPGPSRLVTSLPPDVDAVVIGAGPNSLVAANALADAGWDVLVLEAEDTVGGAVRSAESSGPDMSSDQFSAFYPSRRRRR